MIAAALAAACALGCGRAAADVDDPPPTGPEPGHGLDPPRDWAEAPTIAAAAEAAARAALPDGATVHAHAWAEPSRGCYLAIVEAHAGSGRSPRDLVEQLQAGLGGLELSEWRAEADGEALGAVETRFARAPGGDGAAPARPLRGRLRALLAVDARQRAHGVAAACFHDDREPTRCDDACVPLLAMLQPLALPGGP